MVLGSVRDRDCRVVIPTDPRYRFVIVSRVGDLDRTTFGETCPARKQAQDESFWPG